MRQQENEFLKSALNIVGHSHSLARSFININNQMDDSKLTDAKMYEFVLNSKHHEEERRDEINKNYTALFTAIISIMPFIEKFIHSQNGTLSINHPWTVNLIIICLSIIGITTSLSWIQTLRRIFQYVESFDKVLIKIEDRNNQSFIKYVSDYLYKTNSPSRVTKQTMIVPAIFTIIFIVTLIFNILSLCWS